MPQEKGAIFLSDRRTDFAALESESPVASAATIIDGESVDEVSTRLKKTLEKDGTNFYKFREEIRNEITIAQLKEREVDSKIVITDGEIDNFLNAQSKEIQDEFDVAHILIRVPEDASPEKLEKLKNKLLNNFRLLKDDQRLQIAQSGHTGSPIQLT